MNRRTTLRTAALSTLLVACAGGVLSPLPASPASTKKSSVESVNEWYPTDPCSSVQLLISGIPIGSGAVGLKGGPAVLYTMYGTERTARGDERVALLNALILQPEGSGQYSGGSLSLDCARASETLRWNQQSAVLELRYDGARRRMMIGDEGWPTSSANTFIVDLDDTWQPTVRPLPILIESLVHAETLRQITAALPGDARIRRLRAWDEDTLNADRHFVGSVRSLEANPLQEGAARLRTSIFQALIELPDIDAKVCADLLAEVRKNGYAFAPELTLHQTFGAGVFAIEHPDQAHDDAASYAAGLEAALRVYETILISKPDARDPFLDDLISKRDKGDLVAYVKEASKECE